MVNGAHVIIYSKDAGADRKFFRDILKLPAMDIGQAWLIFELQPTELAIHPSDVNNKHELYFMCEDVYMLMSELKKHSIKCDEIRELSWGKLIEVELPGGGKIGGYQPLHPRINPGGSSV